MAVITKVDSTESGWLFVEVDFGDHINDFLFPDTDDVETIRSIIRNWRATHNYTGDHRSTNLTLTGDCRVPELLGELDLTTIDPPMVLPIDNL